MIVDDSHQEEHEKKPSSSAEDSLDHTLTTCHSSRNGEEDGDDPFSGSHDNQSMTSPIAAKNNLRKESGRLIYLPVEISNDCSLDQQEAIHQAVKNLLNNAGSSSMDPQESEMDQLIRKEIQEQLRQRAHEQAQSSSKDRESKKSHRSNSNHKELLARRHTTDEHHSHKSSSSSKADKSSHKSSHKKLPNRRHTIDTKSGQRRSSRRASMGGDSDNNNNNNNNNKSTHQHHDSSLKHHHKTSHTQRRHSLMHGSSHHDEHDDTDQSMRFEEVTHHHRQQQQQLEAEEELVNHSSSKYNQLGSILFQQMQEVGLEASIDKYTKFSTSFSNLSNDKTRRKSSSNNINNKTVSKSRHSSFSKLLEEEEEPPKEEEKKERGRGREKKESSSTRSPKTESAAGTGERGDEEMTPQKRSKSSRARSKSRQNSSRRTSGGRSKSRSRATNARSKSRSRVSSKTTTKTSPSAEKDDRRSVSSAEKEEPKQQRHRSKSAGPRARSGRNGEERRHRRQSLTGRRSSMNTVSDNGDSHDGNGNGHLMKSFVMDHDKSIDCGVSALSKSFSSLQMSGPLAMSSSTDTKKQPKHKPEGNRRRPSHAISNARRSSSTFNLLQDNSLGASQHTETTSKSIRSGRKTRSKSKTKHVDSSERREARRILSEAFSDMPELR